jgi:hypothetical protein
MRKHGICLSVALLAVLLSGVPLLAATGANGRVSGQDLALLSDLSSGPKPTLLMRTDKVVYTPGEQITLTLDMAPNGHLAGKTVFLYRENMATGEVRYLNPNGMQPAGQVTDITGATKYALYGIPTVSDLVLLGAGGNVGPAVAVAAGDVSNYQYVLDLRDATGQRVFRQARAPFAIVEGVTELTQDVTTNTTLDNRHAWAITDRTLFVTNNAVLTIQPGTYILGSGNAGVVIDVGAKIIADGTATRPIVMTSQQPVGQRKPGDWGGLAILGDAPINQGNALSEGFSKPYGGTDPHDNSGILRYVRVEFAGAQLTATNEWNGISLYGVGDGTTIEHIQVHFNGDDGIEFFGGTVNAKYLLSTRSGDDSIDWTFGWQGKMQFAVAQQRGDDADNGIEADNNENGFEFTPRSNPTLYNVTFIGDPTTVYGARSTSGLLLRRGTAATLQNLIVMGFKTTGVNINDGPTFAQAQNGNLVFDHSIFSGNGVGRPSGDVMNESLVPTDNNSEVVPFTTSAFIKGDASLAFSMKNNRFLDPKLRDPFNQLSPDFRPTLESPALNVNFVKIPPDDGFFDATVNFVGGTSPTNDWTQEPWTTSQPN